MPTDDMWKWVTSPVVGVKAGKSAPGTPKPGQGQNPTSLRMRKDAPVDLKYHGDLEPQDAGQDDGEEGRTGMPMGTGKEDKSDKDGDSRTRNPDKEERDKREKEQQESKQPVKDRMTDAAKEVLKKYAADNLGPLKEKALNDLAKAWKESPGGVIAAGAILGAAGVTYLVKTGSSLPSIPAIPLDFLASRASIFKGAELNIEVKGPITGPESFKVSITFHEQGGGKEASKSGSGRGKAYTPRLTLRTGGARAQSEEKGADLEIEGEVAMPFDAVPENVAATIKAIKDADVEVDVGGTPTYTVSVLSVTDNYKPDKYGLKAPPAVRALTVRLKTSLPPMFHQGKDEVAEASVRVRINRISNEGEAKIRVHYEPFPVKAEK